MQPRKSRLTFDNCMIRDHYFGRWTTTKAKLGFELYRKHLFREGCRNAIARSKIRKIKDSAYYCLYAHYLRNTQCKDHAIHSPSREYSIFVTLFVACFFQKFDMPPSVNDRKRKQNGHFIRNKCKNKRRRVCSCIPECKRLTH